MQTQTKMPPPRPPKDNVIASGFPDDIQAIGDQIAALTSEESSKLSQYIHEVKK